MNRKKSGPMPVPVSGLGFSHVEFCPTCNNMLYPNEDKVNRLLLYACRNCEFKKLADNTKSVYGSQKINSKSEIAYIGSDVTLDPTLGRTEDHPCPRCQHREAVVFQAQTRAAEEEMKSYYVCTNQDCLNRWTSVGG